MLLCTLLNNLFLEHESGVLLQNVCYKLPDYTVSEHISEDNNSTTQM
jgi:hypothetical protein